MHPEAKRIMERAYSLMTFIERDEAKAKAKWLDLAHAHVTKTNVPTKPRRS